METFLSNFWFWAIINYLIGSVCFGYIVAKFKKVDLTAIGSKSATSTNVARALGFWWGLSNGLLDFFKVFIPVLTCAHYFSDPYRMVVLAIIPTLGHIFPIWFNFKGGKGGAPFIGGALALCVSQFGLQGFLVFLGIFVVFMLVVLAWKKTSIANLLFPWVFALVSWFYFHRLDFVIFAAIEGLIIAFALRENIRRLIKGEETTFEKKI